MIEPLIRENLQAIIKRKYDIDLQDIPVEHPNLDSWGDYSSNIALILSKSQKQLPIDIANTLCYEFNNLNLQFDQYTKKHAIFENVYVAPPGFINFILSKNWLYNVLEQIQRDITNYGTSQMVDFHRIALEHSNVNPNKAAHIGHLRNACIGQFIERVCEFLGHAVGVQYYVNDVGVQVATLQMGLKYITQISESSYEKFDQYAWDVYAQMESMINENPTLKEEREDLMVKIDQVNTPEFEKQAVLADRILVEQIKTFSDLDIDYDVVIHERDILEMKLWEKAFEMLKSNPNVYYALSGKSKGCWLVSTKGMHHKRDEGTIDGENGEIEEDKIIVRSNGVPTYTGKDIAYHMWKFGLLGIDFNYKPLNIDTQKKPLWSTTSDPQDNNEITFSNATKVFDVIGGEQTYAMEIVKSSLEFLGYKEQASNMVHVNYGFVYLSPKTAEKLGIDVSDGKSKYGMSGRKGWGIKIDDFIRMLDDSLVSKYGQYESLRHVRNGAIKFEMLKRNTFQDLVFDLEDALSLNGYSGPYIQYTHARACSILNKSALYEDIYFSTSQMDDIAWNMEKQEIDVLKHLYKFPEVVKRSADEFAPNQLCDYLFNLAKSYNTFYNDLPILSTDDVMTKNYRVLITKATKIVLSNGLYLLGITAPEKM